jgi:hypothetical protein
MAMQSLHKEGTCSNLLLSSWCSLSSPSLCVCVCGLFLILLPPYGIFVRRDGSTRNAKLMLLIIIIVFCLGEQPHLITFFRLYVCVVTFFWYCCYMLCFSLCAVYVARMEQQGTHQGTQSSYSWSLSCYFIQVSNLTWRLLLVMHVCVIVFFWFCNCVCIDNDWHESFKFSNIASFPRCMSKDLWLFCFFHLVPMQWIFT